MTRTIVTAGDARADIDVLACATAYAELLRLEGKDALAVVSSQYTVSVTPTVLSYGGDYVTTCEPRDDDEFVMVDISEVDHFAAFVKHDRIREIYDHRFFGQEKHWQEALGEHAHIERVGSCATLIWEQVVARGHTDALSTASKQLLASAMVSNTMNFHASVTTERDINAFAEVSSLAGFTDEEWVSRYFVEQEVCIVRDLPTLLPADTKIQKLSTGEAIAIGQLELWNAKHFVDIYVSDMEMIMKKLGISKWFVTVPSIAQDKNYIYTSDAATQSLLEAALNIHFIDNLATTDALIMRKEMIPRILKQ